MYTGRLKYSGALADGEALDHDPGTIVRGRLKYSYWAVVHPDGLIVTGKSKYPLLFGVANGEPETQGALLIINPRSM
jgi:hypothetical protein